MLLLQLPRALQTGFSEKKIENVQQKCKCWCPVSVMLPWLYQNRTSPGYFTRNVSTFFGIAIFLVSQIIIVLIELRKSSCRSVVGDIR